MEPLADHIGKLVRAGPALFADDMNQTGFIGDDLVPILRQE
jgi:hypothetical protein